MKGDYIVMQGYIGKLVASTGYPLTLRLFRKIRYFLFETLFEYKFNWIIVNSASLYGLIVL